MISSEVQRTLVKSPPELWAEISDPESLARHLGEFGEIRITRVEPEQRVEWQSGDASGSVVIKPSGWGTKVMLTVTRELAEQPADADAESQAEPDAELEPAPEATAEAQAVPQPMAALEGQDELEDGAETQSELADDLTDEGELELQADEQLDDLDDDEFELDADDELAAGEPDDFVESAPELEPEPEPAPRRGFFARLFSRRRRAFAPTTPPLELATDEQIEDDAVDVDGASAGAPRPYNALAVWASQIDSERRRRRAARRRGARVRRAGLHAAAARGGRGHRRRRQRFAAGHLERGRG